MKGALKELGSGAKSGIFNGIFRFFSEKVAEKAAASKKKKKKKNS